MPRKKHELRAGELVAGISGSCSVEGAAGGCAIGAIALVLFGAGVRYFFSNPGVDSRVFRAGQAQMACGHVQGHFGPFQVSSTIVRGISS